MPKKQDPRKRTSQPTLLSFFSSSSSSCSSTPTTPSPTVQHKQQDHIYPSLSEYLIKFLCPVCDQRLQLFSETEFNLHVNQCLDQPVAGVNWDAYFNDDVVDLTADDSVADFNKENEDLDDFLPQKPMPNVRAATPSPSLPVPPKENAKCTRPRRSCPAFKWIPDTTFTVDAFNFGAIAGCTAYFLTHFHSDHYMGISGSFTHGPIYMTETTRALVRLQFPRVREDLLMRLPTESVVQGVHVTVLDANHCPGSAMFLFRTSHGHQHLHVGDFRAHPGMLLEPRLKLGIDSLFLDTTYLDKSHTFPPQHQVLDVSAELARRIAKNESTPVERRSNSRRSPQVPLTHRVYNSSSPDSLIDLYVPPEFAWSSYTHFDKIFNTPVSQLLVVVGSYTVGKEKMFMAIAEALDCKIYCAPKKWRIYATYNDAKMNARRTDNPYQAQVHAVSMRDTNPKCLDAYLDKYQPTFSHLLAIKPTGWTYRAPPAAPQMSVKDLWTKNTKQVDTASEVPPRVYLSDLVPQWVSSRIAVFGIAYSEHSSFLELRHFVRGLKVRRIVPTVGSPSTQRAMITYLDQWQGEKRQNGGVPFTWPLDEVCN